MLDNININMGEIYMATCKISGKSYIGQAKCYTKEDNSYKRWGTERRWKSHIYESRSGKDHCRILNNAIRKYGAENFCVRKLNTFPLDDLDYWETEYIKVYDTIQPNGYNIMQGGSSNKRMSDEGIQKIRDTHLGKKRSDMTKLYIGIGQFNKRRTLDAPMFIHPKTTNFQIHYPIIENNIMTMLHRTRKTLKESIEVIDELEKIYGSKQKIGELRQKQILDMKLKSKKQQLSPFVNPVYENSNKIGYVIENYIQKDGTVMSSKYFTGSKSNTRNLYNANKYLKTLELEKNNI